MTLVAIWLVIPQHMCQHHCRDMAPQR